MIRNYSYFGYRPQYSAEIYYRSKLSTTISCLGGTEPCFRKVFRWFDNRRGIYNGVYTLQCNKNFRQGSGNYCSLSKERIMKIIRYMQTSLKINVKLKDTPDQYVFKIKVTGKPIKHKWILTFCRVFYEWPYNEMAVDVFRIREAKTLNDIDITHKSFLELYNLTISAHKYYIGQEQSLFKNLGVSLSSKELETIFNNNCSRVQDVCSIDNYNNLRNLIELHYSSMYECTDLDESFSRRFELYSKNYKIIKKFKKDEQKEQKNICRRTSQVVR